MACLRGPCPSAWLWVPLQLTDNLTLPTCEGCRKEEIDTPLPGDVLQDWRPIFFYFLTVSPSLFCLLTWVPQPFSLWFYKKKTGIHAPTRWLFRDISLPSSQSARSLNKVVLLVSTPHLQFIGLSCGEQSQYGLGNISVTSCCPLSGHTLLTFSSLQVLALSLSGLWPVECIVSTGRNSFLPWLPLSLLLNLDYHAA